AGSLAARLAARSLAARLAAGSLAGRLGGCGVGGSRGCRYRELRRWAGAAPCPAAAGRGAGPPPGPPPPPTPAPRTPCAGSRAPAPLPGRGGGGRIGRLIPCLRAGRVDDPGDVPTVGEHVAHVAAEQAGRLVRRLPGHDVVVDGADNVDVALDPGQRQLLP